MDAVFHSNHLFAEVQSVDAITTLPVETVRHADGEVIFNEGDVAAFLYLIGEGEVIISKTGRGGAQETLGTMGKNEFFGEMALIDGSPRSARAVAKGDVVLGRLDAAGLDALLASSPGVPMQITRLLVQRFRSSNDRFIEELLNTERMSLLGSMMGGIVHDLRNPLAAIMLASELLIMRQGDEGLTKLGKTIRTSSQRIQDMIQELLDYARGENAIQLREVPVSELMASLSDLILAPLAEKGINVVTQVEYDGVLKIDEGRFVRLLCNIIKNAGEAMNAGGTLTFGIRVDEQAVIFETRDTGCGIPPEVLSRIFEPFVTHGKANGTGLGMAIAKTVVDAHDGSITFDSVVGEGTTCTIAIPRDPKAASAADAVLG